MEDVTIELTGYCPQHCIHCSSRSNFQKDDYLAKEKVKDVVDDLSDVGVEEICLSGGEPLNYPGLTEVVRYINEGLDSKVTLYTSGLKEYRKPVSNNELIELKDSGLDRVVYSVHGLGNNLSMDTEEGKVLSKPPWTVHEFITSAGFEGTSRDKGMLLEDVIERSVGIGYETAAHFVVTKLNMFDMGTTLNKLEGLGVDEVSFLKYVPQGTFEASGFKGSKLSKDYYDTMRLSEEDLEYIQDMLIEAYQKYEGEEMDIRIGNPWRTGKVRERLGLDFRCKAGIDTLEITYRGDVVPCPALKWVEGYNLGSVDESSLKEILEKQDSEIFDAKEDFQRESCVAQFIQRSSLNSSKTERVKRFEKRKQVIEGK